MKAKIYHVFIETEGDDKTIIHSNDSYTINRNTRLVLTGTKLEILEAIANWKWEDRPKHRHNINNI